MRFYSVCCVCSLFRNCLVTLGVLCVFVIVWKAVGVTDFTSFRLLCFYRKLRGVRSDLRLGI